MADCLTLEELARRLGEPVEELRGWRVFGLIGGADSETFGPNDIARARLVQALRRRGIELGAIVEAERRAAFLGRFMAQVGGADGIHSLEETARRVGIGVETLQRLAEAAQLGERLFSDEDVEAFAGMKVALEAGFPEDALTQLLRVYADALGRVAEAESRLFHFYVYERRAPDETRMRGVPDVDHLHDVWTSSDQLIPLIEPTIRYFHRRAWRRALMEDAAMHIHASGHEHADAPGQLLVAIMFVDLAGFTSLTDAMGDQVAADILGRFSQIVRTVVGPTGGRLVKQIGDSFMIVFADSRTAVGAALDIERRTVREPQFAAVRTGIHYGRVLYREGDYVGTAVNLAARIASDAERHQILVTAAVRDDAAHLPDAEFVPLGKRSVRGLPEDIEVFAAVPNTGAALARKLVDPVCGMELTPAETVARLSLHGQERVFCSQGCLERFIDAPDRYGTTPVSS
jgi:adenylate cyclase